MLVTERHVEGLHQCAVDDFENYLKEEQGVPGRTVAGAPRVQDWRSWVIHMYTI